MEKNLLIFISIVLLNSVPTYADNESELPALPTSFEVQVEEKSVSDSSKSFWQKFKEYFGFGEEKKIVEKQPDITPGVRKKEDKGHAQSESMNDGQLIGNKQNYDSISDGIPPLGSTDEGPINVKSPAAENEGDVPDQIKLPEGFGEDVIKNPDSSASSNEPTQDVTNLSENPRKNNNPEAPKIPDNLAEAKNNSAKEAIEPTTQELSIPQLSEADEGKEKAPLEKDAAKEAMEPTTQELSIPQLSEADEGKEKAALKNDATKEAIEPKIEEMPAVKLELPTHKPEESTANSPNITVPEYADAAKQPNEEEVAISKYKKAFEAKSSKPVVVPKLSENELSLDNKSKQVDLKAADLEAFDTKQLQFVNNEAQVLILPNDDIVLGMLVDEAKLDQIDFRSYVDRFWDNYNRLKREPKRLEIERFIDNYDELFDVNNSLYEAK
jgi:hypothetical protein